MNVTLQWSLPTTRTSGKPLSVTEIKHVLVEISSDAGTTWTPLGTFPPSVLSVPITDLDFGTWEFRGFVVDQKDRVSDPRFATLVNEDTSPPSILLALEPVPA